MENNRDDVNTVRAVFESAVDTLLSNKLEDNDDDEEFATIISSWTSWEVSCGEASRANEIFKLLLDNKTNKLRFQIKPKVQFTLHLWSLKRTLETRTQLNKVF